MENTRKRTKLGFILTFTVLLLVFLLPFISVAVISFCVPPVYADTFVGELGDKYELLQSTDEPKIVVVGGSSVAFGLDSGMIKEELGMEVVNFGLYANLGTKLMLDLSEANVNEGDVIVLAPEINAQTLSLYFNSETAVQAMDGNFGMLKSVDSEDYEAIIGSLWRFSADKLGYILSGTAPENTGAYRKEHFNEYGDNVFDRPYNVQKTTPKTVNFNFLVDTGDGITTEYEEFIEYLNAYVDAVSEAGATVYFSFPPINEAALDESVNEDSIFAFYDNLCSNLHCKVISNLNDYVMDEGYFFDSEFHLNNGGVTVRTVRLIDDIKRELGRTDPTMLESELPKPAGYAPIEVVGGEVENLYFTLEEVTLGSGDKAWYVKGLNDEGKKQIQLQIPEITEGLPVVGIYSYAFKDSDVRELYVGENVSFLDSAAFGGAKSLLEVYITKADPAAISVPNAMSETGLAIKDANPNIRIYIPAEGIEPYKADYFWSDYSQHLFVK